MTAHPISAALRRIASAQGDAIRGQVRVLKERFKEGSLENNGSDVLRFWRYEF
jgi:hypothetical protein